MDEKTLQALSKALTHLVFRNDIVERLHAAGANLDDETMKQLNIQLWLKFKVFINEQFMK